MSIARHHAEWLSLVEVSGPFLSMPVLLKVLPQGLDAHDSDHVRNLRLAYEEWEENRDSPRPKEAVHDAWIRFVLGQTLGLPDEVLAEGQMIPQTIKAAVSEHGETLQPDFMVRNPDGVPDAGKPRLLIQVYPATQNLDKPVAGLHWKASPGTRMMELLHASDVRLGLVTNGERWMLVDAPRGDTTGFASWYASLWLEEQITLRAFRTLLGTHRFFAVPDNETLEAMLKESASNQQEVTDQLGYQVRRAVEVLIQSLDRADQDHGRELLAGLPETVLYEAALTVMMRLVFLFSAEERELLLLGDPLYDQHYSVSTLGEQLRETADQQGEEILERRHDAWCRLLSTFRAVYGGVQHERLKLPAYGGNLFDPDRFRFLEGRYDTKPGEKAKSWREELANPLPVNNRTVLHLLEALQLLQVKVPGGGPAEARRLSFRALDIEQIGHVYEGLLDHTAKRAAEPMLGLAGAGHTEPEIALAELENLKDRGEAELIAFLHERTRRSASPLKKALAADLEGDEAGRCRAVCGNDEKLWQRVRPFAGLLREDTFGYPVVIRKGSVFVTAGIDRRSSGTHYTPRSLTEPIVQYTLEPLVYIGPAEGKPKEEWTLRSAREILSLKICDMACGSGAFLVQACRYLAERLLESWEEETTKHTKNTKKEKQGKSTPLYLNPQTGELSFSCVSCVSWSLLPADAFERLVVARRIVAQRCLYGVDKNPLAVEMAKLSLWLLTLAKDKPFTFLDHAIRPGDSLAGISNIEQLLRFSLSEDVATGPLWEQQRKQIENRLKVVKQLRWQLEQIPDATPQDFERKTLMLQQAQQQTARLGYAADLLLAASWGSMKEGERRLALDAALHEVEYKFKDLPVEQLDREAQDRLRRAGIPTRFHWPLEFPEVFQRETTKHTKNTKEKQNEDSSSFSCVSCVSWSGFDALVCNPPFMGGFKITGTLGHAYREHLVARLANGRRGSADLCSYFFLRAEQLLRDGGQLGFLATNTIAQGDTREVGLEQLTTNGCIIPRAVPSRKWPGLASVEVAHVWVRRGNWSGPFVLDERFTNGITPFLTPPGFVSGNPHRLKANEGKSFNGAKVYGQGFVLVPEEAQQLIEKDARNKDVLFPYIIGEDLNSRPDQSPSRWVINFFDWPIEKAKEYPDCFRIIEEKVKPERMKLIGRNSIGTKRGQKWWLYGADAKALYRTIAKMERVMALSLVNNHLGVGIIPTGTVFAHKLAVFACADWWFFTVLQSHLHYHWAWHYSSTMRTDISYSPSDCFETFPFPDELNGLDTIGERYHHLRHQIMLAQQEGLTKTYNRFHDPDETSADIVQLRQLHIEMDDAVAAAYGWTDLDLGHGFHKTKQGLRFTISEAARREVLGRLLKLNHERYAEEVAKGLHDKKGKGKRSGSGKGRRSGKKKPVEPSFFGGEDSEDDDPGGEAAPQEEKQAEEGGNHEADRRTPTAPAESDGRPPSIDEFDTDEIMAAFRQTARGHGWKGRDELLKEVSLTLGYQRLGPKIEEALRGHLRAAIRRKIIESDGDLLRPGTATMEHYELEDLRAALCSVMRAGRRYEREEVIHAVARHLGFARVTDTVRQAMKSAINSGIRQGILVYEGDVIWRES